MNTIDIVRSRRKRNQDNEQNKLSFTGITTNDKNLEIDKTINQFSKTVENMTKQLFTKKEWEVQVNNNLNKYNKSNKLRGTKNLGSASILRTTKELAIFKDVINSLLTKKNSGRFLLNLLKKENNSQLTDYIESAKRFSLSQRTSTTSQPKINLKLIENSFFKISDKPKFRNSNIAPCPNPQKNIFLTTSNVTFKTRNTTLLDQNFPGEERSLEKIKSKFFKTNNTFYTETKANTNFYKTEDSNTYRSLKEKLPKVTNNVNKNKSILELKTFDSLNSNREKNFSKNISRSQYKMFDKEKHKKNLSKMVKICNNEFAILQNSNNKLEKFVYDNRSKLSYRDKLPPETIEEDELFRPKNLVKKFFIYGEKHGMFMSEDLHVDQLIKKHDIMSNILPGAAYKFRNVLAESLGVKVSSENNIFHINSKKSNNPQVEVYHSNSQHNKLKKLLIMAGKTRNRLDLIVNPANTINI